jgi:putative ABC transport system permease protein
MVASGQQQLKTPVLLRLPPWISSPMLRLFFLHSFRYFARHKALALLNILGIALGVTVFVSVQIVNHSALQSFRASVDIVAGRAHLEVVGNGVPFTEQLYPLLRLRPEVSAATPLVEEVALLPDYPGEHLQILGLDLFSNQPFRTFRLEDTGAASADPLDFVGEGDTIALTRILAERLGIKVGQELRLQTETGWRSYRVRYLLTFNDDVVGANEHVALMDIANAQENFGYLGKLTRITLRLTEGIDREVFAQSLRAQLPPHVLIETPARRGQQVDKMLGAFQLNLLALSMVSLLVGMFLIFNTVSAAIIRRQGEIGILRALGFSAWQVRCLFLGEALVLGLLGLALGLGAGVLLAQALIGQVSETITSLYLLLSIKEIFFSPLGLLATIGLGLGAVLLAAWVPAHQAASLPPLQALQPGYLRQRSLRHTGRWLWVSGACAVLALLLAFISRTSGPAWLAFGCALFTLLTFAFLTPSVLRLLVLVWHPSRLTSRLALSNLWQSLPRNAVTITALLTALGMLVGISIMIFSFRQTVTQWLDGSVRADVFIADTANLQMGARRILPSTIEPLLQQLPGIEAIDTYRELQLIADGQPFKLCSIRFPVAARLNPLTFTQGSGKELFAVAAGQEVVMVSEPFARRFRQGIGDVLTLDSPTGRRTFKIAGIFYDYTTETGVVLMDASTFQRHWQDSGYHSFALYLKDGVTAQQIQDQLRAPFAELGSFMIYSNQQLRTEVFRIFEQTFRVTYVLQTVALLVSGLGIFLNLTILIAERRREIGMLRAIGMRRGQLFSLLLQEAGFIGGLGVFLGIPAGLALALVLSQVINLAFFGWTIQWATPWLFLLSLPGSIIFTAVLAGYFPAREAAHAPIAPTLKME